MMTQIPSIDWPRRLTPLTGFEDLLKQNPVTDAPLQEERIPVNLISDFVLNKINLISVGTGLPIVNGKFNEADLRFHSLIAGSSKINLSLSSNTINIDANAVNIANAFQLQDIGNVTGSPTIGGFLKFDGGSWITDTLLSSFYITDGINNELLDGTNDTLTFSPSAHITPVVSPINTVSFDWTANITDLQDVPNPTGPSQFLLFNGTNYIWASLTTIASNFVTNATNVGVTGVGVFKQKVGSLLEFKKIFSASNMLSVTSSTNNVILNANPANIASNIRIDQLSDVIGLPTSGTTLVYDGSSWNFSSVNIGVAVSDELNNTNSFGPSNPLKIYSSNSFIDVNYTSPTDLDIFFDGGISDLNDVQFSSLQNNNILTYSSGIGKWINTTNQFTVVGNIGSRVIRNNDSLFITGIKGITTQVIAGNNVIVSLNAKLTDLTDVPSPTGVGQVLVFDGSNYNWEDSSNILTPNVTASNVGTLGFGVFRQKTGNNLEFRNIASNSSKLTTTLSNNNILLDVSSLQVASEINIENLANFSGTPVTGGYLKYNGTNWVSETIVIPTGGTSTFLVKADSGANYTLPTVGSFNINGGVPFISTQNTAAGFTKINLDINEVANAINVEDLGNVTGSPSNNTILLYSGGTFIFVPYTTGGTGGGGSPEAWALTGNTITEGNVLGTKNTAPLNIIVNNVQRATFATTGNFGLGTSVTHSQLTTTSSVALGEIVTVSADKSLLASDYVVLVDASSQNITITVPTAIAVKSREYIVKKIDNSANTVTLSAATLIDGANQQVLSSQWDSIRIKSDNATWYII
jgi:hypothetical protein